MDEPTAESDTKSSRLMLDIFRKVVDLKDITVVMTSQNPLVEGFADEIYDFIDGKLADSNEAANY